MEPFFIFCSFLALYCGYLTFIDLLRDRQKAAASAPTERSVTEQAGRPIPVGRRAAASRGGFGSPAGKFPLLSRGTV